MPANAISSKPGDINLATAERIGSTVAGVALVLNALAHPSVGRLVGAAIGTTLVQRGLTGHCALYHVLGISTAPWDPRAWRREVRRDPVDRASDDSFPASDPPSWTPVRGEVATG